MSKIILNASVVMKKPKHDADSLLDDLAELDSEPAMALSTFNPNKDKKKKKKDEMQYIILFLIIRVLKMDIIGNLCIQKMMNILHNY